MLVHVVTSSNKHVYRKEFAEFLRRRHDIYVHEKGWREASSDGLELDQFDTDDAAYLIGLEDGRVVCGSRFITTDKPHLLADVFGSLCNHDGVVRDPLIVEWTRGFIVADKREGGGIRLRAQCCAAVMEYCLQEGIREVGGIQEIYWLPLWKRLGWNVRRVGDHALIDEEWCVPAYFEVSRQAMLNARKWGKIVGSNLVHHAPYRPLVAGVALAKKSA